MFYCMQKCSANCPENAPIFHSSTKCLLCLDPGHHTGFWYKYLLETHQQHSFFVCGVLEGCRHICACHLPWRISWGHRSPCPASQGLSHHLHHRCPCLVAPVYTAHPWPARKAGAMQSLPAILELTTWGQTPGAGSCSRQHCRPCQNFNWAIAGIIPLGKGV